MNSCDAPVNMLNKTKSGQSRFKSILLYENSLASFYHKEGCGKNGRKQYCKPAGQLAEKHNIYLIINNYINCLYKMNNYFGNCSTKTYGEHLVIDSVEMILESQETYRSVLNESFFLFAVSLF